MSGERDLDGLRALVTGATSGMGRAAAEELARQGADVIVHGRDHGRDAAVVGAIAASGGKAAFLSGDLSEPVGIDRLVAEAGDVDVLVNNAGFSWFGPTPELKPAHFDALFASDVRPARLHPGSCRRSDHRARQYHHHGTGSPACRNRRANRIPGFAPSGLPHRCRVRRRRRPHRDLTPAADACSNRRRDASRRADGRPALALLVRPLRRGDACSCVTL
jgi:NAD(P)-dependent dehydrogenase (short-subunit alcohol dehydrogenase family)